MYLTNTPITRNNDNNAKKNTITRNNNAKKNIIVVSIINYFNCGNKY